MEHISLSVLPDTVSWNKIPEPEILYIVLGISWVQSSKSSVRAMERGGKREEV